MLKLALKHHDELDQFKNNQIKLNAAKVAFRKDVKPHFDRIESRWAKKQESSIT